MAQKEDQEERIATLEKRLVVPSILDLLDFMRCGGAASLTKWMFG